MIFTPVRGLIAPEAPQASPARQVELSDINKSAECNEKRPAALFKARISYGDAQDAKRIKARRAA